MNFRQPAAVLAAAWALGAGVVLGLPQAAQAEDYAAFNLAPGFTPDPQVGTGLSGGTRLTDDCGYVDSADLPDHVLTLTESFEFLRARIEAPGDVTLLITGPDGRFCSDDVNGLMPEISGSWSAGTYSVWIGDFVGDGAGTFRYQLMLSEY